MLRTQQEGDTTDVVLFFPVSVCDKSALYISQFPGFPTLTRLSRKQPEGSRGQV